MQMKPIEGSSNVAAAGFDPTTGTLRVQFQNGRAYDYADVPGDVYSEFLKADSKGSFVAKQIRGQFDAVPVEDSTPTE